MLSLISSEKNSVNFTSITLNAGVSIPDFFVLGKKYIAGRLCIAGKQYVENEQGVTLDSSKSTIQEELFKTLDGLETTEQKVLMNDLRKTIQLLQRGMNNLSYEDLKESHGLLTDTTSALSRATFQAMNKESPVQAILYKAENYAKCIAAFVMVSLLLYYSMDVNGRTDLAVKYTRSRSATLRILCYLAGVEVEYSEGYDNQMKKFSEDLAILEEKEKKKLLKGECTVEIDRQRQTTLQERLIYLTQNMNFNATRRGSLESLIKWYCDKLNLIAKKERLGKIIAPILISTKSTVSSSYRSITSKKPLLGALMLGLIDMKNRETFPSLEIIGGAANSIPFVGEVGVSSMNFLIGGAVASSLITALRRNSLFFENIANLGKTSRINESHRLSAPSIARTPSHHLHAPRNQHLFPIPGSKGSFFRAVGRLFQASRNLLKR